MFVVVALSFLPLSIYCCVLAWLNRRKQPVMISGVWDAAGLLFGISGFLLVAGPFILNSFNESWRGVWLFDRTAWFSNIEDAGHDLWFWIRTAYFAGVVIGATVLLRWRRKTTAIYNINADIVPDLLAASLDHLKIAWTRAGHKFYVVGSRAGAKARELLTLETFQSMHHAVIYWAPSSFGLRSHIQTELERSLVQASAPDKQVARWLASVAGSLFAILLLGLTLWIGLAVYANFARL